ncbi:fatty-acid amide hydrolase 2-A [Patella vulgata]|uniref:fatty-acid amide hydrolase 2-A n=1 Tax=Patella vulgata TaxID=6465 RepID=UPI0024A812FE|nr:fatty-acid amide hydrolase 2-A [Patella vulgata]
MNAVVIIENILYAVFTITGLVLSPLTELIFRFIYGKGEKICPIKDELLLESATSLANKIRTRKVTAEHVMQVFIERVKEVNPKVNAVVANRYEEALKDAKQVDSLLDNSSIPEEFSQEKCPFLGVPLSVKEAFATKDMPHTSGLISRQYRIADHDSPCVANLRKAGFIPFVSTNISELCMWYESANHVYGRTKNAYNTSRIVGGSSGGEGCILSTGGSVAGVGSDIGGSIRMPAFFNGVYGHRPSKGIVCNDGQYPPATKGQIELLSTGPMCRYSEDLIPLLKTMAGKNADKLKLDQKVDLKKLRIFTMEDDGGSLLISKVDPELKEAQRKAVRYLENIVGVKVTPVKIHRMKYGFDMWCAKIALAGGTSFSEFMGNEEYSVNGYLEAVKWIFGQSQHTLPAILLSMIEKPSFLMEKNNNRLVGMLKKLEEDVQTLLGDDGILLYPTHPRIAPYHNQPLFMPFNFAYTAVFNALALPVTQTPMGLSTDGLPMGIQIVGSANMDRQTIAVAKELESGAIAGWVPPSLQISSS